MTAYAEYHHFLQGKEFQAVMKVIASRLSPGQPLSAEQQITPEDVLLAFEACAYDIILEDGNQDRWCSLFTPETVEIVNYALDLEDYIQRGYAYDITGKVRRGATTRMQTAKGCVATHCVWSATHATRLP